MPNYDPETQASSGMVKLKEGRYDWLLVGIIVAVALFLRLYHLASAPPGLSGDELFNAIDAQLIGNGNWPIFFEGNYGREASFFYLMAASIKLFGSTVFAVRLPAVLLGTGSVILAFLLGRNLFNRRVGLLASALTAVSLWPLMASRWGLRAVSLTFLTALTVYFFHKAAANGRLRFWLLGGLSLGLTFYTYIPSRVFPAVLIAWFGWLAWRQREVARRCWRQFLLALAVAFLIFAPFAWYMIQFPDKVNQRINTMSSALADVQNGEITAVIEPILGVLRMFSFVGDKEWRYHLSGQPVFDPITSLFFYLGLAVCLWFAFARKHDKAKWSPAPTCALVLLWLGAMLSPNALASVNSSFLRAAGAVVPVYLITAIGADAAYQWLIKKWPRLAFSPVIPALVVLGLVATMVFTWHSYFNVWSNSPEVREIYAAQTTSMGAFLDENPPPAGTRLYIGDRYAYGAAPRLMIYYADLPITWFLATNTLPWDDTAVERWYLLQTDEPLGLLDQLPADIAASATPISFDDGMPSFVWYRVPGTAVSPMPAHTLSQSYQNGPTLLGYDLPETIYRGETVPLLLYWQIPEGLPVQDNQETYAQAVLEDGRFHNWSLQGGLLGYPQAGWQAGDRFIQQIMLDIPAGLPPEPMTLRIILTDNKGDETYPLLGEPDNRTAPFVALSRPLSNFTPTAEMPVWDEAIVLTEAILSTKTEPGLPIDFSLDWVALQAPSQDYAVTLTLVDPATGAVITAQTNPILPDVYPTSQWQAGEQLRTQHRLQIPIDVTSESDTLDLVISLEPIDGAAPAALTQGSDKLADITIVQHEHRFEVPPISQPTDAQFGPDIRLLGYDLDTQASDNIGLKLYWQALNTPANSYTVFTHLLNENGEIVAQVDSAPVSDAWLTSAWLPGEVIVDTRSIALPDGVSNGRYALAFGLYDDNGRLPVTHNNQPQANDQLIIPDITLK